MIWKCWCLLIVLLAACPFVLSADIPATSPNATKQKQLSGEIFRYMRSAKRKIDKAWERQHSGKWFFAELNLTLDTKGKIASCTVVSASKAQEEELNSVQKCLRSVTFGHLPPGLRTLDLYWEFKSREGRNSVEYLDSTKASTYYTNLLGGTLPPSGDWLVTTAANNAVSLTKTPEGVAFGPYLESVQHRIERAWLPPKGHESDKVVLVFRVHRDGLFSNLRIQKSSGVAVSDQAAYAAVQHCIFRPLPACPNDFIDVELTFEFRVSYGGAHAM